MVFVSQIFYLMKRAVTDQADKFQYRLNSKFTYYLKFSQKLRESPLLSLFILKTGHITLSESSPIKKNLISVPCKKKFKDKNCLFFAYDTQHLLSG